jgi:hypothetical protein
MRRAVILYGLEWHAVTYEEKNINVISVKREEVNRERNTKNAYKISVAKTHGILSHGRFKFSWEMLLKVDLWQVKREE